MSLVENYRAFARYNRWMNQKLYALVGELSDEERQRDMGAFFGSVHATLNHILLADRVWLARFTRDKERFTSRDAAGVAIEVKALNQILYEDFRALERERQATDHEIEAFAQGLDETAVLGPLVYQNTSGQKFEHPLWWAVSHFFNHQTHHRGQITGLLTALGRDPGVTDLVALLRSENA